MPQTQQISQRIEEVDTQIKSQRWTAGAELKLMAILAQLETAKALSRIADQMEKQNGTSK